jgi:hypothetical protein
MPDSPYSQPHQGASPKTPAIRLGEMPGGARGDVAIDPETLRAVGDPPPIGGNGDVRSTPPPAAPQEAVRIAELERTKNELQQALARQGQDFAGQLEDMRLQFEIMAAAGAAPAAPAPQVLPDRVDLSKPPTWGELAPYLQALPGAVAATAIQTTWDLSQDEINTVLRENPALVRLPEPNRTQLVHRAALSRRKRGQNARGAATASAMPQGEQRPVAVIPHVEGAGAPPMPHETPQGTDSPRAAAQREYEAARQIKDPQERHKAMRAAWEKSLRAGGIDPDKLGESAFKVG